MNDTFYYFLKVNIAIAMFYLFYRLFFAGDTFWKTRRYYMLFSILLSFVYPFFSVENWLQKQEPIQQMIVNYGTLPEFTVTPVQESSFFNIENVLLMLYCFVGIILLVRFFVQIISILRIRLSGQRKILQDVKVIAIEKHITPFSFFGTIFICPALHNEEETKQILAHELTHVRQGHSFDVLLSELLCMLSWFNPAAWLLKKEIRQNLEFLADHKVLESGFDSKSYQYHLLQLSYQTPTLKIINKFNVSPLKKRIMKMNQQKTAKAGLLKYSLIVPLALALVLSSNAQSVVKKAKESLSSDKQKVTTKQKAPVVKKEPITITTVKFTDPVIKSDEAVPTTTQKNDNDVFDVCEKMPQYPGGDKALMDFLSRSVKYPEDAIKQGIQGKVILRFVVTAEGKVENAEILRSVFPSVDKEAIRVVNQLPTWIPGEQNGKKISVYYTLPIAFKLDGDKKNTLSVSSDYLNFDGIKDELKPLLLVDGKIVTQKEASNLNHQDIKEISVLKSEKATALYGEKGKNGVVLITTKKENIALRKAQSAEKQIHFALYHSAGLFVLIKFI